MGEGMNEERASQPKLLYSYDDIVYEDMGVSQS